MLKKLFKRIKRNPSLEKTKAQEEIALTDTLDLGEENDVIEEYNIENEEEVIKKEVIEVVEKEELDKEEIIISDELELDQVIDDKEYINHVKIIREKSIKAIDVYTEEEQLFKTHKECSKKLKVPLGYIKENLKYRYTDYFGEAINFLSKELNLNDIEKNEFSYLDGNKTPSELFNMLNNKIFTANISEDKRDEILSNNKIEPIKMHYKFECIDEEYDVYFEKYKSIIRRGGKKKIELVNKKGEVIDVFKSLDDCAQYLHKEKNEVVEMLKLGEVKYGRNEIRYSLRNI
ncbi:hypothetical protein CHF27_002670 [Romboutsia maritimum]|uniref:Nuclease-associated modular DNA-binding 1 domain-containing protein n=1 Tax=Romboutsia maritimum TaxID=2020948 RepID=A0A371IVP9_9FIRM|nr:hypothetical protein [Romboutsia maritimum]RDY24563.1 hypothetical protein CHF27_002670 [Romboutsia maritimum]